MFSKSLTWDGKILNVSNHIVSQISERLTFKLHLTNSRARVSKILFFRKVYI